MQKTGEPDRPRYRREGLAATALAALAVIVFLPALDCEFVNLDDPEYVTTNPHIKGGLTAANIRWALGSFVVGNWHPLTVLSLQSDASIWRKEDGRVVDPFGFHLTNIVFHAGSVALLFLALHLLTGAFWRSAAAAALFAVHPLRVESVAWVAERKDVLSTFFGMAALLGYAFYVRRPSVPRYLWIVVALVLSLLCKQMLVTLPFLLLVLDWWPARRVQGLVSWWRLVAEKLPLLAVAIAFAVIVYRVQAASGAFPDLETLQPAPRVQNAIVSYVSYLGKTFWPAGLAVFYPHRAFPWGGGLSVAMVAAAFVVLTALTAAALVLRLRAPYLLTGWLWYLGTLVPVIGFVQVGDQAYADRYSYFPQVGIAIAVCWGLADLLRARPRWSVAAAVASTLCLALVSREQLKVWHDSVSLWEHNLQVAGESPLCLTDLGLALEEVGRRPEAEKSLRRSLELNSKSTLTHINLGNFLVAENRLKEAEEQFKFVCDYNPGFAQPRTQLAEVYLRMNRLADAEKWNKEALELKPDLAGAHCLQGMLEMARENPDGAEAALRKSLELQSDLAEAHSVLGRLLIQRHNDREGMAELQEAIRCNPRFGEGHLYLAAELERRHDKRGAEEHHAQACRWAPGLHQAWAGWGRALVRLDSLPDAAECFRRAIGLLPDSPEYKKTLDDYKKILDEIKRRTGQWR